jgi:hypothetical protein
MNFDIPEQKKPEVKISAREELGVAKDLEDKKRILRKKIAQETEPSPDAEKMISDIDFVELKNVMTEKIARICPEIATQDINLIPTEDIKFHKQYGAVPEDHACYDSMANMILIDYHRLRKMFPNSIDNIVKYACFHEQMHAVSKVVCEYGTYENKPKRIGFKQYEWDDCLFTLFEEAVNEKMTREIISEYEKRKNVAIIGELSVAYDKLVSFLDELIGDIAQKTNSDRSTVWEQIQREKLIGKEEGKKGIFEKLEKVYSREFVDNLAQDRLDEVMKQISK